ncbi:hypothetical protein OQA88_10262 [Cercophora sp. LCS_1]
MAKPSSPKPSVLQRARLSFSKSSRESSTPEGSIHALDPPRDNQPSSLLPDLKPDDVVIAVMGVTGVGKSSFIACLSETAVVGDGLKSCTAAISIHAAFLDGRKVYLIDTPGFDDTTRTDTSILIEIATWLKQSYDDKIQLAGVVYIHRISDSRVRGSGTQNIALFKEICGAEALPCVVLATSMWDLVPREKAEQRERDLISKEEFWGGLIRHGCRVARHDNGSASAAMIIRHILSQKWPEAFQIQNEMAEGTPLIMTKAGKVLGERLDKKTKENEDEAKRLKDEIERLKAMTAEAERKAQEERHNREQQEEKVRQEEQQRLAQEERKAQEEKANQKSGEELRRRAEQAEKRAEEAEKRAQAERLRRLEERAERAEKEAERLVKEKEDLKKGWCSVM